MLYLVSTPIGNLSDITLRAIDQLKKSDLILCEDTRKSSILLNHHNIKTPLKSFHQFSESANEEWVITQLKNNKIISIISDAGTPGISDPGERLVARCRKEGIEVSPLPGACAAIAALSASGLSTSPFQFLGFLPRKSQELKETLVQSLLYPGTSIYYESPKRIQSSLETLSDIDPSAKITIARELTKKFEEFLSGDVQSISSKIKTSPIKGEIVLLIEGDKFRSKTEWQKLSAKEHVLYLEEVFCLSTKEAIKLAAELRGVPKREVYKDQLNTQLA